MFYTNESAYFTFCNRNARSNMWLEFYFQKFQELFHNFTPLGPELLAKVLVGPTWLAEISCPAYFWKLLDWFGCSLPRLLLAPLANFGPIWNLERPARLLFRLFAYSKSFWKLRALFSTSQRFALSFRRSPDSNLSLHTPVGQCLALPSHRSQTQTSLYTLS